MSERLRGVNLSGWFIPESWVTPSLYAATGASDATELQQALGASEYTERLRQHYETFIGEFDFERMAAIGFNAVRLPVPWYVFGSQNDSCAHIPAIDYVDRAFEWASKYDMRVLLDLATVPGGQGDSNDRSDASDVVADWHSSTTGRAVALEVLERLASRYGDQPALYGIELLDSPVMSVRKGLFSKTDGIPSHYLRNYYRDAYALVRKHMSVDKAVVFSASGYPDMWRRFMSASKYENVMMDIHLYHYRDDWAVDITSPKGISQAVKRNREAIKEARACGFPVLVGEWSAAALMSSASVTPEGRSAYERVFTSSELASFEDAEGWFFQTWKTEKRIPAWDARVALGTLERAMLD